MRKIMRAIRKMLHGVLLIFALFLISFWLDLFHPYFFAVIPETVVPAEILSDPETQFHHVSGGGDDRGCSFIVCFGPASKEYFYLGRIVVNFKKSYLEFEPVTPAPGEEKAVFFKEYLFEIRNKLRRLKNEPLKYHRGPRVLFERRPSAYDYAVNYSRPLSAIFPDPASAPLIAELERIPREVGEKYFKNGWVKEREYLEMASYQYLETFGPRPPPSDDFAKNAVMAEDEVIVNNVLPVSRGGRKAIADLKKGDTVKIFHRGFEETPDDYWCYVETEDGRKGYVRLNKIAGYTRVPHKESGSF